VINLTIIGENMYTVKGNGEKLIKDFHANYFFNMGLLYHDMEVLEKEIWEEINKPFQLGVLDSKEKQFRRNILLEKCEKFLNNSKCMIDPDYEE